MAFFSNKHVLAALIIAPVLALLSYFLVDQLVQEQPQSAKKGKAYPLVAKSNCRYTSGECDLVNASFKSTLTVDKKNGSSFLLLNSSHNLEGVKVGFSKGGESSASLQPLEMNSSGGSGTQWQIKLPVEANKENSVMVVMLANGAHYYAQTTMGFSEYRAAYKTDFRTDIQSDE